MLLNMYEGTRRKSWPTFCLRHLPLIMRSYMISDRSPAR